MKYMRWAVFFQPIGIICAFIAFYMPSDKLEVFKNGLFVFGIALTLGYWMDLLVKVYLPYKKKEK